LFGATLAETGLRHRSRYATATLVIGANLPDIDVVFGLWGSDFELYMRRGLTHGILALILLPLLLTGSMMLWHRWRSARAAARSSATASASSAASASALAPPAAFHPRAILALAFLSICSHPLLDWLNTYGVRLLMPFDQRWFYGDTLFIVDPWFWLLMSAGVVLARSGTGFAIARWTVLALLTSALVLTTNLVPPMAKIIWSIGVASIAMLRWRAPQWAASQRIARLALAGLVIYVGAAFTLARMAESSAAQRFPMTQQAQANPAPAVPNSHRVVVVEPDHYHVIAEDGSVHDLPRQSPDDIVLRAMADSSIRGFVNWTRFPYWTVEEDGDQWLVTFYDLRYQGPDVENPRGIGFAQVRVDRN